jgi:hypothetical protein
MAGAKRDGGLSVSERTDDLLVAAVADESLPAVVREHLMRGGRLEDITLHAEGWWSHEGGRFEHARLIEAFFRGVERSEGGTWMLRLGRFTYPITVEDTGYFVVSVRREGAEVWLKLTDQTEERLDPQTLVYGPDGRLVARVKGGAFEARFMRPVYHALLDAAEADGDAVWLTLGGERVRLI